MKSDSNCMSKGELQGKPIPVMCSYTEMKNPSELKPNPRNPNKHPESQVEILAKAITHHGWRSPIVVSKRSGLIVAGHGRLEAAKRLGLDLVPVDFQEFETEADELTHLLGDNSLRDLAQMDDEIADALRDELAEIGVDIELTGIDLDLPDDCSKRVVKVTRPPSFVWYLFGIPMEKMPDVQRHLAKISTFNFVKEYTTVNDEEKN